MTETQILPNITTRHFHQHSIHCHCRDPDADTVAVSKRLHPSSIIGPCRRCGHYLHGEHSLDLELAFNRDNSSRLIRSLYRELRDGRVSIAAQIHSRPPLLHCLGINPKSQTCSQRSPQDSNSRRLSMKREPFQRFGGQGEICLALGNQEVNFICT